ncbi:MAG: 2-phosphosulfolactate phosphatase [Flavobacteriales bacterium]|nr:2-phosphosulfolactate phosphatase [Flavobacteriales bacterium]
MSEESSGYSNKIEVCFSPALFPIYFQDKNCVVVVIDIFRATSAICAAIESGVEAVIPVSTIEEATEYKSKGFIVGAERSAEVIEGFDFGNSPLFFKEGKQRGKTIVLTTTNGTTAIDMAKDASKVVIGSFLNLSAVAEFVEKQDKDIILLCAGWKNRFNLEDTLFAGALAQKLNKNKRFSNLSDCAIASITLYESAKNDLYKFLDESSHRKRLSRLNLEEDIIYCLKQDIMNCVPVLKNGKLVNI